MIIERVTVLFNLLLVVPNATGFTTNLPSRQSRLHQEVGMDVRRSDGMKSTRTQLGMFGNMFGGNDAAKSKTDDGSLAKYTNLGSDDVKFNSMSDYISKWGNLFETDPKGMGLTTPVIVRASTKLESDQEADPSNIVNVEEFTGVQLIFKNTATGYKSSKDEATEEKEGNKKAKEKLQGGVEVLVEKTPEGVRVRARRCNTDDDTMIKEMSEEAILSELQKAIGIWKRENL